MEMVGAIRFQRRLTKMDHVFTFTPSQLISAILGICGAVSVIIVAITHVATVIGKLRQPEMRQNERIDKLEERLDQLERDHEWHKKKVAHLEKGNAVTQRAILALLEHGISGNAESDMKAARQQLQEYLTPMNVEGGAVHGS